VDQAMALDSAAELGVTQFSDVPPSWVSGSSPPS